jgi:hypothetical protein
MAVTRFTVAAPVSAYLRGASAKQETNKTMFTATVLAIIAVAFTVTQAARLIRNLFAPQPIVHSTETQ